MFRARAAPGRSPERVGRVGSSGEPRRVARDATGYCGGTDRVDAGIHRVPGPAVQQQPPGRADPGHAFLAATHDVSVAQGVSVAPVEANEAYLADVGRSADVVMLDALAAQCAYGLERILARQAELRR